MAIKMTLNQAEELFVACLKLDFAWVKLLVEKEASPSMLLSRPEAASTLHLVCGLLGHLDILKTLTDACRERCDFALRDKNGWTPLHHAASYSQLSILKYLVSELKCDPMIQTEKGETALHLTCQKHLHFPKKIDIINFLVSESNCDVNATDMYDTTPIMLACTCHNSQVVVRHLIDECHCDLSLKNEEGNTALHLACREKNVEVIKIVLGAGVCDINAKNNMGFSPFLLACCQNVHSIQTSVLEVLKLLVNAKCDVSATTISGETALMLLSKWVTKQEQCQAIIHYLVSSCDSNLSVKDHDGNTALHVACIENNNNFVEALSKEDSCDLSVKNKDGNTPLHLACSLNNRKVATIFMSVSTSELYTLNSNFHSPLQIAISKHAENPELSELLVHKMYENCDECGNSPLHIACINNDIQMTKVVAELECDPNLTNNDGDTPLHLACKSGSLQLAQLLLEMNCDTKIKNNLGITALMMAFNRSYLEIVELLIKNTPETMLSVNVKWLLDNGVNPFFLTKICLYHSKSILHILCGEGGDLDVLKLFAGSGCDYQPRDDKGLTPLHYACYSGNLDIVKYLVNELSCNPSVKTMNNEMALHLACISHAKETVVLELVTYLMSGANCDCNEVNSDSYSPLMLLLKMKLPRNRVAQFLILQCSCDLSIQTSCGETALHLACAVGNTEIVKTIVLVGCDPCVEDNSGMTPLLMACIHEHRDIVNIFLKAKEYGIHTMLNLLEMVSDNFEMASDLVNAMCTKQDGEGNTQLHVVCTSDNIKLARLIAKEKYCLNMKNNKGDTPLHIACRNGNTELVTLLLSIQDCHSAVNVRNCDGDTPIHLAGRNGKLSIVEMLQKLNPESNNIMTAVKQLIKEGFEPSKLLQIEFVKFMNLLHIICGQSGDLDMLKCLAQSSNFYFYLTQRDQNGHTPLHYACIYGHLDIVTYLLTEQKYDRYVRIYNGVTLLHMLCDPKCDEKEALSVTKFLTASCSCDCNAGCSRGYTLLMSLLSHKPCMMSIVQYLISECQCDLSLQNHNGDTALHIACMNGNLDAVI